MVDTNLSSAAKVEIFSAPQCTYCEVSKTLLEVKGVEFETCDIANEQHHKELVSRLPTVRSLPQLFVNGVHIGGYEDLKLIIEQGKLEALLQAPQHQQ